MDYLVHAMNLWNPCLGVLRAKGWTLQRLVRDDDEPGDFEASRAGVVVLAGDPVELLGLATLWDELGPASRTGGHPNLLDELMERAYPEDEETSGDEG